MKQPKFPDITDEEEAENQRQITEDPDDCTPTNEELAQARPFSEVFPELYAKIQLAKKAKL